MNAMTVQNNEREMTTRKEMTKDAMPNSMQAAMPGNSFEAEAMKKETSGECAMMTLIRNQKTELEESLNEAKLKFADANLIKDNWSCAKEREIDCKVIEGQISILTKMEYDLENMLNLSMTS